MSINISPEGGAREGGWGGIHWRMESLQEFSAKERNTPTQAQRLFNMNQGLLN